MLSEGHGQDTIWPTLCLEEIQIGCLVVKPVKLASWDYTVVTIYGLWREGAPCISIGLKMQFRNVVIFNI